MRSLFVICVFLIHFGITACSVKSNPLNDLEKTFMTLHKRCSSVMSVRKREYLRHVEDDFKTEAFSKKETIKKLREEYQDRLNKSEKYHKMYLEMQAVTRDLEERLKECEHLYLITENEVAMLNIKNNRLKRVLSQLEEDNDNHNTTIESKDKLIKQLQAQLEQFESKNHGPEREIKVSLSTIIWIVFLAVLLAVLLWRFFMEMKTNFEDRITTLESRVNAINQPETVDETRRRLNTIEKQVSEFNQWRKDETEGVTHLENRITTLESCVNEINQPETVDETRRRLNSVEKLVSEFNQWTERVTHLEDGITTLESKVNEINQQETVDETPRRLNTVEKQVSEFNQWTKDDTEKITHLEDGITTLESKVNEINQPETVDETRRLTTVEKQVSEFNQWTKDETEGVTHLENRITTLKSKVNEINQPETVDETRRRLNTVEKQVSEFNQLTKVETDRATLEDRIKTLEGKVNAINQPDEQDRIEEMNEQEMHIMHFSETDIVFVALLITAAPMAGILIHSVFRKCGF